MIYCKIKNEIYKELKENSKIADILLVWQAILNTRWDSEEREKWNSQSWQLPEKSETKQRDSESFKGRTPYTGIFKAKIQMYLHFRMKVLSRGHVIFQKGEDKHPTASELTKM